MLCLCTQVFCLGRAPQAREDAAQRAAEVAAQQAAEAAARAAEVAAAAAAREEDRQRRGVKTFTTRFKGSAAVTIEVGGMTRLSCYALCSSAFGAPQALHADAWPNTRDAAAGVTRLCRAAAAGAVAGFESDVQQRSMSGQGPLACMDGMELTAWLRLLTLRLEAR